MAKIDLHIDTETTETHDQIKGLQPRTSNKPGLLSTITITDDQIAAFQYGFGSNIQKKRDNLGYAPAKIRQEKKNLKNTDRCNVIAVTGGRAAFDAIVTETDNPPFVCLVGETPDFNNLGNCVGGISLDSWKSNAARVAYLTAKLGCNVNQVGLYYNPNSGLSAHETQNWDKINPPAAVSSARPFSGAGGVGTAAPTNNAAQFAVDFAPGGNFFQGLRAIIISADPFFQTNKDLLIQAANNWLNPDATRYVCYPLQDYQNENGSNHPTPNRSTLYGPNLITAYNILGFLTKSAIENNSAGFFTASNVVQDV
jgi:hypothetical protein